LWVGGVRCRRRWLRPGFGSPLGTVPLARSEQEWTERQTSSDTWTLSGGLGGGRPISLLHFHCVASFSLAGSVARTPLL
jgi:hypothetical protein